MILWVIIAVVGVATVLMLRAALLLQELFQRLGRLESTVERAIPDSTRNEIEGGTPDRKLVNEALDIVLHHVRRGSRFWGLRRVWCFLTPPAIPRLAPERLSAPQMLRLAQRA
jgi:hypothetical protein